MSTAIPFDTLTYAKRLEAAGCEKQLAEEQALAQAAIIMQQEEKLDSKLEKFEEKLDKKLAKFATKAELKSELKHLEHKLLVKLGGLMSALFVIATGVLGFILNSH